MRYDSQQALVTDIRRAHDALCAQLREIPKSRCAEPGVWGDGWSVSDLVAHLAEWQSMFLVRHDEGLTGAMPRMPATGFRWNETPKANRVIWEKLCLRSLPSVRADFDSGYRRILAIVDSLSGEQLLMPGHFAWTGKHSLTSYLGPNTASHYRFALRVIRRWLVGTEEVGTPAARPSKRLQPTRARKGVARRKLERPRL